MFACHVHGCRERAVRRPAYGYLEGAGLLLGVCSCFSLFRWRKLTERSISALQDLGDMPDPTAAGELAIWVAALVNPIPALGGARRHRMVLSHDSIRGCKVPASKHRWQLARRGLRDSPCSPFGPKRPRALGSGHRGHQGKHRPHQRKAKAVLRKVSARQMLDHG